MKHPERVEDYLEHIAQAIDRAIDYANRVGGLADFRSKQLDQDAVIRNIEIIGEAARRVLHHAPEFVAANPGLPWNEMRGMRNKMIHDYFNVQVEVVWRTVKSDLPRLKQQVDDLLRQRLGAAPPPP